jgi:hypothetical protein
MARIRQIPLTFLGIIEKMCEIGWRMASQANMVQILDLVSKFFRELTSGFSMLAL